MISGQPLDVALDIRIAVLEAMEDVRSLLRHYAWALDYADFEGLTACFEEYVAASRDDASFADYLECYVTGVADEHEYLALIGLERPMRLPTTTGIDA